MRYKILCDFDGTIALEDVTDSLLERFALPEWHDIEDQWLAGAFGSRECMARQVDLIRAAPADFDRHLDGLAIDAHFPAFVAFCAAQGVALTVVSDGLDYGIRRILARHGLDHLTVLANRLEVLDDDRYRLDFPHARPDCRKGSGTCKCAVAADARQDEAVLTILIGDGTSDFCAASSVDMVFAKDKLLAHCRANDLPHAAYGDFAEAQALLSDLLTRHDATAPLLFTQEFATND